MAVLVGLLLENYGEVQGCGCGCGCGSGGHHMREWVAGPEPTWSRAEAGGGTREPDMVLLRMVMDGWVGA